MVKKIAVWGTFDKLHDGHMEFLKQAKKQGHELYVVIIPDDCVEENKKKAPANNSIKRKINILNLDFVRGAYIDCLSEGLESILALEPDIFVFGHDQKTKWEKQLKDYLQEKGLSPAYVHLKAYNTRRHGSDIK